MKIEDKYIERLIAKSDELGKLLVDDKISRETPLELYSKANLLVGYINALKINYVKKT